MRVIPPTAVEMPSGRFIDIAKPDPACITLDDIAHKLAQTNRWGGSARYPISVAQHAVFVSRRLEQLGYSRVVQLGGLHHDSPEAFLGDIPRPWKVLMGAIYGRLTRKFERAIDEALGLPQLSHDDHAAIKTADDFALLVEARNLMPSQGRFYASIQPGLNGLPKRIITPWYWLDEIDWRKARRDFIYRHRELTRL